MNNEFREYRTGLFDLGEQFNAEAISKHGTPSQIMDEFLEIPREADEITEESWLHEEDPFGSPQERDEGELILFHTTEAMIRDAINSLKKCIALHELDRTNLADKHRVSQASWDDMEIAVFETITMLYDLTIGLSPIWQEQEETNEEPVRLKILREGARRNLPV